MDKRQENKEFTVEVKKGFEEISEYYDLWFSIPFGAYADRMEKEVIFSFLEKKKYKRMIALDIGTGTGVWLIELLKRGFTTIGLDISLEMMNVAKVKLKEFDSWFLVQSDAGNLPISNDSISVVLSVTTLEFIAPVHREKILKEIYRVLAKDGLLILGLLCSTGIWGFETKIRRPLRQLIFPYTLGKFFSSKEIVTLLRKTGFKNIEFKGAVYSPTLRFQSRFLIAYLRVIEKIERKIRELPFFKEIGVFLAVKAEK